MTPSCRPLPPRAAGEGVPGSIGPSPAGPLPLAWELLHRPDRPAGVGPKERSRVAPIYAQDSFPRRRKSAMTATAAATNPQDPATPPEPGRDQKGRFAKGNPGGPGNPFAREVAAYRTRLLQRVKEGDVDAVADQLIQQARDGDLAAIRLFLLYVLGRPAAAVDPDGLDAQELNLYKREAA